MNWLFWIWVYLAVGLLVAIYMSFRFRRDYNNREASAFRLWRIAQNKGENRFWFEFIAVFTVLYVPFFLIFLFIAVRSRLYSQH